jgi:hypothetical protein
VDVVDARCLIDVGSVQLSLAPLAGRASVVTAEGRGKGVGEPSPMYAAICASVKLPVRMP